MREFSQRSLVSNFIAHNPALSVPDCIAFFGDWKIWTVRDLMCSSGTPVIFDIST